MSNRLDQEREARLQPIRIKTCKHTLEELGYHVEQVDHTLIIIHHPKTTIRLFPYSGWWSGKIVGSNRGFRKLLTQLKAIERTK